MRDCVLKVCVREKGVSGGSISLQLYVFMGNILLSYSIFRKDYYTVIIR